MKFLKIAVIVVLVAGVAVVALAPIGPVPGFFIGGTPAAAPAQWPDTSHTHEITLRVPGTLPRAVIVWVVEHGGELHVVGARDGGWVTMIGNRGPVEMRLGDDTYTLDAERLTFGWRPVLEAYVDKYRPDYPEIVASMPSADEAEGQVAVFRLNRR